MARKTLSPPPDRAADRTLSSETGPTPAKSCGNFFAYNMLFTGGVFVAAGDINGDGVPDIITGADIGSSNVRVFNGADTTLNMGQNYFPTPIVNLNPYGAFTGGARVASGDIDKMAGRGYYCGRRTGWWAACEDLSRRSCHDRPTIQ